MSRLEETKVAPDQAYDSLIFWKVYLLQDGQEVKIGFCSLYVMEKNTNLSGSLAIQSELPNLLPGPNLHFRFMNNSVHKSLLWSLIHYNELG